MVDGGVFCGLTGPWWWLIDVGWMWKVWCCVGHSVVGSGVASQVCASQGVGTRRLSTMSGGVSAMLDVRHQ